MATKLIVLEIGGYVAKPDQDAAKKALEAKLGEGVLDIKFSGGPGAKRSAKTNDVPIYDQHRFAGAVTEALGRPFPVTFTHTLCL